MGDYGKYLTAKSRRSTSSLKITKVKQRRVWSVSRWVTTREYQVLGCVVGVVDNGSNIS